MNAGPEILAKLDRIDALVLQLNADPALVAADGKTRKQLSRIGAGITTLREYLSASDVSAPNSALTRHEIRNHLNRVSGPCQLLQRLVEGASRDALEAIRALIEDITLVVDSVADEDKQGHPTSYTPTSVSPARILVAEDDVENRRFLVEVLSGDGHSVEIASDGVAALEQAQNADLDLLLLDLGLPEISGFEILERLQASGWHTPVIVVTGRRAVDDAVRCIEHGADDFLTKPIQVEILRARVKSCVEKMRLREREFAQFFPPKLARSFARRPSLIYELPSRHAEVSILFCDIRNFTAISERLGPDKTTRWLRAVMHELSELVIANEGVLVDFAGDQIMAMWGAPEEVPDHATRACDTAVQILQRLPNMSAQWAEEIGGETDLAIGVNSGRALVGHVGTARKTKYGALGDAVNIGSRVLGATAHLQTRLLISGATRSAIDDNWEEGTMRRLCRLRVKNIVSPVELFQVLPATNDPAQRDLRIGYEQALAHYEQQALHQAAAVLGQLLVDHPDDGPSLMLMSRVVSALLDGEAAFDPVWTMPGK